MSAFDFKSGSNVVSWVVGVLVLSLVARVGWELGGKVWGMF